MATRSRKTQGFTLVEILIVVVILGILAAIVIPQFTSASQSARSSSTVSQLQTIRSQLELAQIQHQGTYPDLVTSGWTIMTSKTDPTSNYSLTNADGIAGNEVGPYLQQAPTNPFTLGSVVKATGDNSGDWEYDNATGAVKAVLPAALWTGSLPNTNLGLSTNDVIQGN